MKKKRVIIIFLIYKGKVVPNGRCVCMEVLFKWTQEAGSGWGGRELAATLGEAEYLEILGEIS